MTGVRAAILAPGRAVNGGCRPCVLTVDWLGRICYLSTFCNRILHITAAKIKIKRNGKRLSNLKTHSVIGLYPLEMGQHLNGKNRRLMPVQHIRWQYLEPLSIFDPYFETALIQQVWEAYSYLRR